MNRPESGQARLARRPQNPCPAAAMMDGAFAASATEPTESDVLRHLRIMVRRVPEGT